MINMDCRYYDGDEDCNKCCKHGYIFGCEGCDDYVDFFGNKRKDESWMEDMKRDAADYYESLSDDEKN
jgi:hypothetical protein